MKKLLIVGFASLLSLGVLADPFFSWGSTGGLNAETGSNGDVYNRHGDLIALDAGWLIEIVDILTGDLLIEFSDLYQDTGYEPGEFVYFDYTEVTDVIDAVGWNGQTVTTIIYDNNVKANAEYKAEFQNQFAISWDPKNPPYIGAYDAGGVTSTIVADPQSWAIGTNPGEWVAVPEPTVAALIGIFGGGLIVGRRFFNKEA